MNWPDTGDLTQVSNRTYVTTVPRDLPEATIWQNTGKCMRGNSPQEKRKEFGERYLKRNQEGNRRLLSDRRIQKTFNGVDDFECN